MKKAMLVMGCLWSLNALACDFCSVYLGIQPNDNRHSIRLSFRSMTVGGEMPVYFSGPKHLDGFEGRLREYYEGIQLGAQVYVKQRWRLSGQISYQSNHRFLNRTLAERASGPGDLYLQGEYLLSATQSDGERPRLLHRVFGGLGVFIPTGLTTVTSGKELVDLDLQPGSGAFAVTLTAEATVSINKWGLVLRGYALGYESRIGGKHGNALNLQASVFRQIVLNEEWMLLALTGTNSEWRQRDRHADEALENTGGNQTLASAGAGIRYKTLELSGSYEWPALNGLNENQAPVLRNWRVETRFYF